MAISKQQKVLKDLIKRIKSGEFSDTRLPSERKLAEHYKLNRLTVRNAIKSLIEKKIIYTRDRSGNYVYDSNALVANLKNKRFIWVLVDRKENNILHSQILNEFSKKSKEFNFCIDIFYILNHSEAKKIALELSAKDKNIDGIFVAGAVTAQIVSILKESGLPVVMQGQLSYSDFYERNIDRVVVNSNSYSYKITQFLLNKSYKHICLINHISGQYAENIKTGYMKALDDAHVTFDSNLVINFENKKDEYFLTKINNLIKEKKIDAIFLANIQMYDYIVELINKENLNIIPLVTVGTKKCPDNFLHYNVLIDFEQLMKEALFIMSRRLLFPKKNIEYYSYNDFKIVKE